MDTAEKRLGYVFPGFVMDDAAYRFASNAALASQSAQADTTRRVSPANVANVLFGEHGSAVSFATRKALGVFPSIMIVATWAPFWVCARTIAVAASRNTPIFQFPVVHVVGLRTREKVFRITATGSVTAVADTQAGRDGTVGNRPSHSVGAKDSVGTISSRAKAKHAIATRQLGRRPKPTFIGLADVDFLPESCNIPWFQCRDAAIYFSHDESPLGPNRIAEILPERSVRVN